MPNITGLSESTKYALVEYCHRRRMTQISWVENHLEKDLKSETEVDKKEEAAS